MVTSVCAAILLRLTPSLTDGQGSRCFSKRGMTLIHNLSQYVHSMAQGKIGSGFDISAAVWGTHIYRRFAEECLRVPASTAIAEVGFPLKHSLAKISISSSLSTLIITPLIPMDPYRAQLWQCCRF